MPVTKENLQEALKLHAEWLAYKTWQFKNPETRGKQPPKGERFVSHADLRHADLSDAKLIDANLIDANLSGANLSGANLSGADLQGAIGNGKEVKSIQADKYPITWTDSDLVIGCQQHPLADWLAFSDEQKASFASDGLPYLNKWLLILDSMGVFDSVKESKLPEGETHA